jgi:esterase
MIQHPEFAALVQVAEELGLPPAAIPNVRREFVEVENTQEVSVLIWGNTDPEIVFLHGGGQNAHTWDLVAMCLGRPAAAIDLPGHGHSSWRADRDYLPVRNARAVAAVMDRLAVHTHGVVGMSLGGLTTMRLASIRPDLVQRAVFVDITPRAPSASAHMTAAHRGTTGLLAGSRTFASLNEMVELAVQAAPGRAYSALRRGVIHNARELEDGRWAWRHDFTASLTDSADFRGLWNDVGALSIPAMLVTGGDSAFVSATDLVEFTSRAPTARVESIAEAGHSVQSDQPRALTRLLADFVFGDPPS